MGKRTEAEKRAQKKYMGKFSRVEIKMTAEEKETAQTHAIKHGESLNGFINRAITETIKNDTERTQKQTESRAE